MRNVASSENHWSIRCIGKDHFNFRKQQLDLDMEKQTGSKQEKQYDKSVYCHPAYSTYMQSTS